MPPPPPLPLEPPVRTIKLWGRASAVLNRWPQEFAKAKPLVNDENKRVMMATHMPFARYMCIRHDDYPDGEWAWGCDLCSCELTQEHIKSNSHRNWTRQAGTFVPRPRAVFPGPAFFADSDAKSDFHAPPEPGGRGRVRIPQAWECWGTKKVLHDQIDTKLLLPCRRGPHPLRVARLSGPSGLCHPTQHSPVTKPDVCSRSLQPLWRSFTRPASTRRGHGRPNRWSRGVRLGRGST